MGRNNDEKDILSFFYKKKLNFEKWRIIFISWLLCITILMLIDSQVKVFRFTKFFLQCLKLDEFNSFFLPS